MSQMPNAKTVFPYFLH